MKGLDLVLRITNLIAACFFLTEEVLRFNLVPRPYWGKRSMKNISGAIEYWKTHHISYIFQLIYTGQLYQF
jgi:hypothetical protein